MQQDYIKIIFPKEPVIATVLEVLMDEGMVLSYETTDFDLSVLHLWEEREELLRKLNKVLPEVTWKEEKIEGRDWNQTWIEGFQPIKIKKDLWVTPPWHEEKIVPGHERIIINPSNAFGTGTHESTFLALTLLPKMLQEGDSIMDLGCGSGILSIAARKLGAGDIYATDFDEEIKNNMNENLELNSIDDIKWDISDVLKLDSYACDLALINIQKHVILPLLELFNVAKDSPKRLILAGLLYTHRKEIRNALKERGYKILKIRRKNDWIAVSAVRRRKNEK